ncbi:MAG: response regulator [Proteobacteria bacterium]|nr:response regulator [Pseudomonadota bacterium]
MTDILIIDDDAQLSAMLKQLLERHGYSVITAPDGNKGINLFREKGARLIITDLIMPVKEGIETIAELIKDSPNVKIIAISGGGRLKPDSYLTLAETFGALRSFTKPINRDELLAAVAELLS